MKYLKLILPIIILSVGLVMLFSVIFWNNDQAVENYKKLIHSGQSVRAQITHQSTKKDTKIGKVSIIPYEIKYSFVLNEIEYNGVFHSDHPLDSSFVIVKYLAENPSINAVDPEMSLKDNNKNILIFYPFVVLLIGSVILYFRLRSIKKSRPKNTNIDSNISSIKMAPQPIHDLEDKTEELPEFGGTTPLLIYLKSGALNLVMEMPPFYDDHGNSIDGDDAFPELWDFSELIAEFTGVPVEHEDRELFVIDHPKTDTPDKIKAFLKDYWKNRKPKYKNIS